MMFGKATLQLAVSCLMSCQMLGLLLAFICTPLQAETAPVKNAQQPIAANQNKTQQLQLASGTKQYWPFESGVAAGQVLTLTGINRSEEAARLLIRIDPDFGGDYFTRFNQEKLLPPGPFRIDLLLDDLQTERKRRFSAAQIRRIYLAVITGDIGWQQAALAKAPELEPGLIGWDFGPRDQAVALGFRSVSVPLTPEDQAAGIQLSGPVRHRNRPYYDPMLRDGFEGLQALTLPVPDGLWQLRLWVDDIGEWEYLPHVLNRKIRANGQTLLNESLSSEQWLNRYYLNRPPLPDLAAATLSTDSTALSESARRSFQLAFWEGMASKRGRLLESLVQVTDGRLKLSFDSPLPAGRFISALVLAPVGPEGNASLQRFDERRKTHFLRHWPVIDNPGYNAALPARYQGETLYWAQDEAVTLRLHLPAGAGNLLVHQLPLRDLQLYRIRTGLRRAGGQEQALQPQPFLEPQPLPEPQLLPKRQTFKEPQPFLESETNSSQRGQLPPKQSAGSDWLILGKVDFALAETSPVPENYSISFEHLSQTVQVQRIRLRLPAMTKPAGIYLDYAPHLLWFQSQGAKVAAGSATDTPANEQANCDYRLLKRLGLTGVAPALPTPTVSVKASSSDTGDAQTEFIRAAQAPLLAGLTPPLSGLYAAETHVG